MSRPMPDNSALKAKEKECELKDMYLKEFQETLKIEREAFQKKLKAMQEQLDKASNGPDDFTAASDTAEFLFAS